MLESKATFFILKSQTATKKVDGGFNTIKAQRSKIILGKQTLDAAKNSMAIRIHRKGELGCEHSKYSFCSSVEARSSLVSKVKTDFIIPSKQFHNSNKEYSYRSKGDKRIKRHIEIQPLALGDISKVKLTYTQALSVFKKIVIILSQFVNADMFLNDFKVENFLLMLNDDGTLDVVVTDLDDSMPYTECKKNDEHNSLNLVYNNPRAQYFYGRHEIDIIKDRGPQSVGMIESPTKKDLQMRQRVSLGGIFYQLFYNPRCRGKWHRNIKWAMVFDQCWESVLHYHMEYDTKGLKRKDFPDNDYHKKIIEPFILLFHCCSLDKRYKEYDDISSLLKSMLEHEIFKGIPEHITVKDTCKDDILPEEVSRGTLDEKIKWHEKQLEKIMKEKIKYPCIHEMPGYRQAKHRRAIQRLQQKKIVDATGIKYHVLRFLMSYTSSYCVL